MRFTHFAYILLLLFASCKSGQVIINNGTEAFEQKKFVQASQLLEKEVNEEKDVFQQIEKLKMLAEAYDHMSRGDKQVETLKKIVALDSNPQYLFDLALAQKQNEQYAEALSSLNQYKDLTNDFFYSATHINFCEEMINYDVNRSNLRLTNLENINSSSSDYASSLFRDGKLIFTSSRASSMGDLTQPWDNSKSSDLFEASRQGDTWGQVKALPAPINSELPEGIASFSKDYETMYFTRCDYLEFGDSYCRVYMAEADGENWYEPELVSIFSDSVNIGQPHLSADGQRLYFSSDAEYGYGGNDIYFMLKDGDGWSQPYNAGFSVNTEKDELFPTTDSKGNLYYSSDGKQGYGGLDIFKAAPDKFAFGPSQILPFPINSGADDFSLTYIKEAQEDDQSRILEKGLFSSNRQSGKGSDDIYIFEKIFFNLYALELKVLEKQYADPTNSESEVLGTQPLDNATVSLLNTNKNTPVDGIVNFDLAAESDYKVLISKTDYFNKSISFTTKDLRSKDSVLITLFKEVELERIFPEKEIVIQNIYYDYDKASLREESLPVLDKLVSFFEENNDLTIEIGSHTDSRGSDSYNKDLSQRRAQSVVDYFISKGVPAEQLSAKGYGETKLINACKNGVQCSEEEHQENRRTTFRVISSSGVLESGE